MTLTNIQPNYIHYSFGVQESLPLDVPIRISPDDPVHSFLDAIERINLAKYFALVRLNNSGSHDRVMLLRVILFAFMVSRKNISLRELESLVYKKRIVNSRKRLYLNASELSKEINSYFGYDYPLLDEYQSLDLYYVCQYLMEVMVQTHTEIRYGTGHRKSPIQRYYDSLLKPALKLKEYEEWLLILGNRNSCSKTGHDATFMQR